MRLSQIFLERIETAAKLFNPQVQITHAPTIPPESTILFPDGSRIKITLAHNGELRLTVEEIH